VGHPPEVPVTGERKNVKILGAIELWHTRFHFREDTVFNASTYLAFLEQLARAELETTLTRVFGEMQCHPALIRSYLLPFC